MAESHENFEISDYGAGTVQVAMNLAQVDGRTNKLTVNLVSAKVCRIRVSRLLPCSTRQNILACDVGGKSDPYASIRLLSAPPDPKLVNLVPMVCAPYPYQRSQKKHKTSVQKNTLNPVYNERFDFSIVGPFDDHVVHVEFFDHDMVGHDGEWPGLSCVPWIFTIPVTL